MSPIDSPRETVIAHWLREELAKILGVPGHTIDPRERFKAYGLDSMRATALVARIGAWLGTSVRVTVVFEHSTIELLARHLAHGDHKAMPAMAPSNDTHIDDPIAVIGIGCRFPGKASSPRAFWDVVRGGVDAITEIPKERWDAAAWFDADRSAPGKMSTRWGGLIEDVDRFDARFFGIAPREAVHVDPQQRVMLELAWESLEDAGIPPEALAGTATGVFVGAMWSDYARLVEADPSRIAQHTATGHDTSLASARVSYTLGLQGPSLTVNTASSSSLVAVHLACESLRRGESTLALAGGVTLVVSPLSSVAMTKFGGMSPDGRCKAFDARANGYVRGEGAGLVVLKPLSRALADGDPIYCVILGGAVNNDGFSNGLTAPNPQAQEDMLRTAYARAGVDPATVQYVETHGPGTLLGDPIEANALGAVLGVRRSSRQALRLGSAKTNFGHAEAAAGIAGLIKVALCLKHRRLAPNLHFEKPNPHIPFDAMNLAVQREFGTWPDPTAPLVAGVSSFSFGGTNCHVVLRDAPESQVRIVPIAAPSAEGLQRAVIELLPAAAATQTDDALDALAGSAAALLSDGAHRLALTVASPDELRAKLLDALARPPRGDARGGAPRVAFVCSGHGSQWLGMGASLMRREPVFRARIEECDRAIRALSGWSLIDELVATPATSRLHRVDVVQPAIFAIQIALGALWRSWGIAPSAVVGHSLGEIAACHLAGVLELDDAIRIVVTRSRMLHERAPAGGMLSVDLAADDAIAALADEALELEIAAYNGPVSTVLAGDAAALDRAAIALGARGARPARVNVDFASHGAAMGTIATELAAALEGITPRTASTRLVCAARAVDSAGPEHGAAYWGESLRAPVRFAEAIASIAVEADTLFIELSPHPILTRAIEETIAHRGGRGAALASCRRDRDERASLLDALCMLYTAGAQVAWDHVAPAPAQPRAILPATLLAGRPANDARDDGDDPVILPLSTRTAEALTALARAYAGELRDGATSHRDLAFSAGAFRGHAPHRIAVVERSRQGLADALDAFAKSAAHPALVRAAEAKGHAERPALVLAGGATDCLHAARALLDHPVFRASLLACEHATMAEGGPPYVDAVRTTGAAPEGSLASLSFGVHVALAALWRAWGIELGAVLGTGAGAVAAAHASGLFTLDDAARQIAATRAPFGDDADLAARARRLVTAGHDTFLDAHGLDRPKLREALGTGARLVGASADDVRQRLLVALADLYVNGASVAWRRVSPDGGRRVRLPTYPWQRRRYWLDDAAAKKPKDDARHPLVGPAQTIAGQPQLVVCEATIDPARVAYLAAFRVAGVARVPAGAFLEMIAAAARHKHRSAAVTLDEIVFHDALAIGAPITAQVVVAADAADRVSVEVASLEGASTTWKMHATARVRVGTTLAGVSHLPDAVKARCAPRSAESYYEQLAERRWSCGDTLRPLDAIWRGDGEALGRLRLPEDHGGAFYVVHPLVVEACVQLAVAATSDDGRLILPASIERIAIHRRAEPDAALYAHVRRRDASVVDACVVDGAGRAIVELHGLAMRPMDAARTDLTHREGAPPASVRA